jgi:Zn-dependent protease
MKSFTIGRISGIEIELHSTFVLFIVFLVVVLALFDLRNLVASLTLIVFLFTSVFFHELTHSVVSMHKGIKVNKIILLPIGGMALTENFPEEPKDEFLISIAGPLFNFGVVIFLAVMVALFDFIPFPSTESIFKEGISISLMNYPVFALMYVNLMLGAFNLLVPALPLDGGRVWRSLLAIKFGKTKATKFVAKISEFIALILFLGGIFSGNIILAVIAIFIYFASKYENEMQEMKEILKGVFIKKIINKKIPFLKKDLFLNELFELMEKENQFAFFIKKKKLKYIDLELMKKINKKKWNKTRVSDASVEVHPIPVNSKAEEAMQIFMTTSYELIAVATKGKLSGIIERKEMQKLFEIAKAKKEKK